MLGATGRGPDILAPYIITLYDLRETLSAIQHPRCDFGANVVNYYHYCLENDLFLTHALGDPQVDRGQQPQNEQRAARKTSWSYMLSKRRMRAFSCTAPSNWQPQRPLATRPTSPCRLPSYGVRICLCPGLLHPHEHSWPENSLSRTSLAMGRQLWTPSGDAV